MITTASVPATTNKRSAPIRRSCQRLKLAALAALSALCLGIQAGGVSAHGQSGSGITQTPLATATPTVTQTQTTFTTTAPQAFAPAPQALAPAPQGFASGQAVPGRAQVLPGTAAGVPEQLPNGMIAVSLPTQIMPDGRVQILMPDYRVLTLPAGSYTVQLNHVYAQPSALQAIGYPLPQGALLAGGGFGTTTTTRTAESRKVLGFVPSAGTTFTATNSDPTFGTQGLSVTQYECVNQNTTTLASLSGDVAFDTDQSVLRASARAELDALVGQMQAQANGGATFTITGHTDSRGSEAYNQGLSERRARSVSDYLVSRGVPQNTLRATGRGELSPIASNDTADGRARNRRVEINSVGGTLTNATRVCSRAEPLVTQTETTFIAGSIGPAAIWLGPAPGNAPVTQTTTTEFASVNERAENQGLFGGIGQSISDTPWFVWAGAAVAAAGITFLVLNNNDDEDSDDDSDE